MFFLIAVFVFALAYVLTPIVTALSWKVGAVDIPQDWRRMHHESIPRGGGVAIILPFILGCILTGRVDGHLGAGLFGCVLMLSVGLLDDIFCLGPRLKLLLQLATVASAVLLSDAVRGWGSVVAVLWVVAMTNAHNFIDGMDGLLSGCCSIEAILLGGTLALAGENGAAGAAVLLGVACLGFRPYNRHPARVFAGDCGSESLGFMLGFLSLPLLLNASFGFSGLSPIFLFAYPLADMVAAVLRRVLRGRSPLAADRGHLHHRLYAAHLSVPQCVGVLMTVCASLGSIGVFLSTQGLWLFASVACLLTAFVFLGVRQYVMSGGFTERG